MDPRIHRVVHLMTTDLSCEVPLHALAQSVNISVSRLSHLFKDEMGTSPIQYLRVQRIEKAKVLLETTFLNVQEIMIRVGVKDKSHFVRDFKRVYGLSPLRYRIQYLNNERTSGKATIMANS